MNFFGRKKTKTRFQFIICELYPIQEKFSSVQFSVLWKRGKKLKNSTALHPVTKCAVSFNSELFTFEGTVIQDKSGNCKKKPLDFYIQAQIGPAENANAKEKFKNKNDLKTIGIVTGFDLGDLFLNKGEVEVGFELI
jgi:hypothetical protein